MSNTVNKVIILGTISMEPSVKYAENGFFLATMNVLTKSAKRGKIEEKLEYKNEWHKILLYNKFENMVNLFKKNCYVYIEGSLRTNKWQDKEGIYRYSTEIIASDIKILDSKTYNEEEIDEKINEKISDKDNKSIFDENIPF